MTSFRQFEANRRNALKSTGPATDAGKQRSRRNAVRHGLTAETVITTLEDEEDYKAFELSVTSGFDATTAVERELVLRLASLLWRLRRATAIDTGLLQLQSEIMGELASASRTHGHELTGAFPWDQSLAAVVNRALSLIWSGAMIEATRRSATWGANNPHRRW